MIPTSPKRSLSILLASTFLVGLATTSPADPPTTPEPRSLSSLTTIVLDPGHGGSNDGAIGVARVYERYLTLALAKRLQARLRDRFPGLQILLTRHLDTDLALGDRTHFANESRADLFISLHFNAATNIEANGIEVFYLSPDDPTAEPISPEPPEAGPTGHEVASILVDLQRTYNHGLCATLAEILQASLIAHTGATDRGVRQARYRVLRGALMPAVVAELGFLTHPEEGFRVLDPDYSDRLVDGLVEAVERYDQELSRRVTARP
ncbi:MAG: N-acetylmuramoyl-L-alanine amidase [Bradymonadales bacterium]|nr:N-acetylmuramoyl-L-alanine amidase [Bradymonadales bacterium]